MSLADTLSDLAATAGAGALAGLAGTAAMTVSSSLEAKARGREPSATPGRAAAKVLGVEPTDESSKKRLNTFAHWGYGTSWGAVRGLLDLAGLRGAPAAVAHLGAVWGGEQVVLPATGASSPAWRWGGKEVGVDLLHHGVYAAVTSTVYELLDPHRRNRRRHP